MVPGRSGAATHPKPSLRTELLLNLAVLAAGALVLAVCSAMLAPLLGRGLLGFGLLMALVVADVAIFIGFGRYLVTRLVTEPMELLVGATQAVASGEMARRAPPGATQEFERLAESVNLMTERLLDAQSALVRAEKLASSSVTVVMVTSPRSMRSAHSSAAGLEPSRTSADLSISEDVLMTRRRT